MERGCSYRGRGRSSFVLLEADQSAEAIVAEPNLVLMTDGLLAAKQERVTVKG